jgi:hypothetical protein
MRRLISIPIGRECHSSRSEQQQLRVASAEYAELEVVAVVVAASVIDVAAGEWVEVQEQLGEQVEDTSRE